MNIEEIVILPEVTKGRKNSLHEIVIATVSLKEAVGQKNVLHKENTARSTRNGSK